MSVSGKLTETACIAMRTWAGAQGPGSGQSSRTSRPSSPVRLVHTTARTAQIPPPSSRIICPVEVRRRVGGEVERGADDLVGVGDPADARCVRPSRQRRLSSGTDAWKLSVWNVPQMMPFTRMPRGANSCDIAVVSVLSPALAAA